jgi:hypothetical protein
MISCKKKLNGFQTTILSHTHIQSCKNARSAQHINLFEYTLRVNLSLADGNEEYDALGAAPLDAPVEGVVAGPDQGPAT